MFDFSFFELVVIGVVALIVIGPERMPKVARTAGLLFGRAQRYVSEVKADINNQLKLEELRKIEADLRAKASTAEHVIIEETQHVEQEFRGAAEQATPAAAARGRDCGKARLSRSPCHPQKSPQSHRRSLNWVWILRGPTKLRLHPSDHA